MVALGHPTVLEDLPRGAGQPLPVVLNIEQAPARWAPDVDFEHIEPLVAVRVDALLKCVVGHNPILAAWAGSVIL
jgi:hypothetical protein